MRELRHRELNYLIELWSNDNKSTKDGCICQSTANCKEMTNDLIVVYSQDYYLNILDSEGEPDYTKATKIKNGWEWKNNKVRLTVNYKI